METCQVFVHDPLRFLSMPDTATAVDAPDRRNLYVAPSQALVPQQQ